MDPVRSRIMTRSTGISGGSPQAPLQAAAVRAPVLPSKTPSTGGALVFEVPNLAYWPKRFAFFVRGETVHAPIDEVYHSAVPFTGHHREYTLHDARYVVRHSGFEISEELAFNYTVQRNRPLQLLKYLPAFLFNEWAEVFMLGCHKLK
jgi:hypothetical protein